MVSELQNVAIDCADAYELARFWSEVLDRPLHPEDEPGAPETEVMLPEGGPQSWSTTTWGSASARIWPARCTRVSRSTASLRRGCV